MTRLLTFGLVLAVFFAVTHVAAIACAALGERLSGPWARSTALRAGLALAPVGLGAAMALSLLSPELSTHGCHCIAHPHHVHVCFEHPMFSWSLVVASGLGAVWLFTSLGPLGRVLAGARRAIAFRRESQRGVPDTLDGIPFHVVPGIGARALTFGVHRPSVVVGRELWQALEPDARRAIVQHERAHVLRRDPLTLLCLQIVACAMPSLAGKKLVDAWRRTAELACDRYAAAMTGDECAVASALVACGRLQTNDAIQPPCPALDATAGDDLETRVMVLLADAPSKTVAPASDLGRCLATLGVALTVSIIAFGGEAHHAVETLLGWFS